MEESTAYQYILDRGAVTELHTTLLTLGRELGPPDETVEAGIKA